MANIWRRDQFFVSKYERGVEGINMNVSKEQCHRKELPEKIGWRKNGERDNRKNNRRVSEGQ